jgi:hypothetical protein
MSGVAYPVPIKANIFNAADFLTTPSYLIRGNGGGGGGGGGEYVTSFIPTLSALGGTATFTYTHQSCKYFKNGQLVTILMEIGINNVNSIGGVLCINFPLHPNLINPSRGLFLGEIEIFLNNSNPPISGYPAFATVFRGNTLFYPPDLSAPDPTFSPLQFAIWKSNSQDVTDTNNYILDSDFAIFNGHDVSINISCTFIT